MRRFLSVAGILAVLLFVLPACSSSSKNAQSQPETSIVNYVPSVPDTQSDYPLEPVSGKSAFDYFKDEKLLVGWNLGNTLDSHHNRKGHETVWGNPRISQELMDGVKAAGFNLIRIPVTWMGHFGPAPDYHIAEDRMQRVGEVVDMAHNAGLKVIINLHHDGATENRQQEVGWLTIRKMRASPEDYQQILFQFSRAWKQIAVYFQNYGDWLMFESLNEVHDGGWGSGSDSAISPQLAMIAELNQLFIDVVRSTGGNNAQRYVILPGLVTKPKWTLAPYFTLPEDPAQDKQVVSFHYYDPDGFAISARRSDWGSDADKARLDTDFTPFKEQYVDKNIPVIIGEAGAVRQLYPEDAAKESQARQTRLNYIGHVFAKAKEYGLVPVYWDNGATTGSGEKFGVFNRRTGEPNMPESEAVIKTMINAVGQ